MYSFKNDMFDFKAIAVLVLGITIFVFNLCLLNSLGSIFAQWAKILEKVLFCLGTLGCCTIIDFEENSTL